MVTTVDWSKTYSTDQGYFHIYKKPCERESNIASQWVDIQESFFRYSNCIWPINVGKFVLGNLEPKSKLFISENAPMETCAISEPANSTHHRGRLSNWEAGRRNYFYSKPVPGPILNIQIIPIYAEDTAPPRIS